MSAGFQPQCEERTLLPSLQATISARRASPYVLLFRLAELRTHGVALGASRCIVSAVSLSRSRPGHLCRGEAEEAPASNRRSCSPDLAAERRIAPRIIGAAAPDRCFV